jgi:nicotinate-nucleotide pyrophosphorylase (carboxylating)
MSDPALASPEVSAALEKLVQLGLAEDVGSGDATTEATVRGDALGSAVVVAKEELVVSGLDAAQEVFLACDPELHVAPHGPEGRRVAHGDVVLRVSGRLAPILTGERTALNFLGHLSGIATLTRRFVDAVHGTGARILDTRKTIPGWRTLEKSAVRAGGGFNHRMGLYDFVLVKDNHIAAAGGITAAVARVRESSARALPMEVEVASLEQLEEALALGLGRILLDNMSSGLMAEAVRRAHALGENRPELEASGNVTLENVRAVAESGVDWISVGALTHSARCADLSMRVVEPSV